MRIKKKDVYHVDLLRMGSPRLNAGFVCNMLLTLPPGCRLEIANHYFVDMQRWVSYKVLVSLTEVL